MRGCIALTRRISRDRHRERGITTLRCRAALLDATTRPPQEIAGADRRRSRRVSPANCATFPKVSGRIRESSKLRARITAIFFNQLGQFSEGHFASAVLVAMMVRTYPGCSRRIRARMVTPISSLISSGGLSICCATAEPSKQVTSSSLDRNGISSSSRLVASAFCKASVNLAERTRAALNSFAKPVLSVRNVRMAATLFYRSIDFSSQ